ncbi:MAG: YtxH domain-containing protein [Saprospiraceae bacterium]|nr:YtxH domain-containing protein [Saprospiraceae bacterium]
MSTRKVIFGALAGLATGAIAGVLFAPEKGAVSRKQIIDKGDDYVGKVKSKFNDFSGSVTGKMNGIQNSAEGLVDKGKEKYDETKKDVRSAVTSFRHGNSADNKQVIS